MGSVSLSWVSRQRGRQEQEMPLIEELSKLSVILLPAPSIGAGWAWDSEASRPQKRERSVCIYTSSSDLIPLIGSKLSLEEGRELQSIGLNPSLCSRIFILLHQLHAAVKPTQSTLGAPWCEGNPSPRPLAECCSCHRGFLAPGGGQTPPCRCVPTGWGVQTPAVGVEAWESPCPETALNAVKLPPAQSPHHTAIQEANKTNSDDLLGQLQ